MATISKADIGTGNTIQAEHITRIIDALNGTGSADVIATGSFTGSFNGFADTWTVQDLTVFGTASINYFETIYETSSIIYQSGSTKFGNSADDTHQFTGSVFIDGDTQILGNTTATGSFSGSFVGDGSGLTGVVSSSYAVTASYADNALSAINTPNAVITASNTGNDDTIEFLKGGGGAFSVTVNNVVSSSYALTASYALNGGGGSDTNFANTSLTFDGNRAHDLNGFRVIFESASLNVFGIGSTTGVNVNAGQADRDFRVYTQGNTSTLFVEGSSDRVGVGKNTPNATLDVNGNAIITGSLTITDTIDANSGSFNYIEADEIIRHTGDNGTGLQFGSDQVAILGNTYINAQFSTTVNTIGNSSLEQPLTIHGDSTFEDRIITTTTDNAITAAGTFNPTGGNRSYVTLNGTIAVTLDDGVQGQILHIYCRDITSAGTTTITPTNKAGFTSIAFDAIGETATLMFADGGGGQWYLISSFGATVS
jgi:hypothetical protein